MALVSAKNISVMSVLAASLFTTGAFADASPSTTDINITAKVVDATCTAGWDTSGVSLDLGSVSTSSLAAKGDIGASKPLTLTLTGCTGMTKVHLSATGNKDSDDSTAFSNSGTAKGVAVQLFGGEGQSTQLLPQDSTQTADYTIKDGNATLALLAKLERTTDASDEEAFAAGTVVSKATLNLTYE